MEHALYYREQYYLLPEPYATVEEFLTALGPFPAEVTLRSLKEDHEIRGMVQKGVCIAPYFYRDYGFPQEVVHIEHPEKVYPVEVELLTQAEYNQRLRELVLNYCPGCFRYKPLSNRVQSLNGHFEEIALNGVCFYRQNSKPAPRSFRRNLWFDGGSLMHLDPIREDAAESIQRVRELTYLKLPGGEKSEDGTKLYPVLPRDFLEAQLTAAITAYMEKHLYFTKFRICVSLPEWDCKAQVNALLEPEHRETFRKQCKKYGVGIGILRFRAEATEEVLRSLEKLLYHDDVRLLYQSGGELGLLLMDPCDFLKALHFRAPLLHTYGARCWVYDQYAPRSYEISFDMELVPEEGTF